ncbi:MAG: nucleotide pyrophosphohydrolase [Vagococcus sp.]|uniref:nucleotide pyrophosphohydrolase n=1 Tax=Vagococcus sp. TaxID=1933889 RepID=UPI002FC86BEC
MNEEIKRLDEMQQVLDDYINQFKQGYFSPLSQVAKLAEEVGELAREVNHSYGEIQKKASEPTNSVADELGDVLITTIIMANALDIDLTEVFKKNMAKFNQRDNYRFERKDDENNERMENNK